MAESSSILPGNMMIKKKDYKNQHDRKSLHSVRDNYGVLTDLMGQIGHKVSLTAIYIPLLYGKG
jgi:hypothetical protein